MSEEEQLGKLAYEAYWSAFCPQMECMPWDRLMSREQLGWRIVAKAVAERVIAEMQTAEEASE